MTEAATFKATELKIMAAHLKAAFAPLVNSKVYETIFTPSESGVEAKGVDPAHTIMTVVRLSKEIFEDFQAGGEIPVDVDDFDRLLKKVHPRAFFSMKTEENNRISYRWGRISVNMAMRDTNGITRPKIPNLSFDTKVILKPKDFLQEVATLKEFSDHVYVELTPEGLKIWAEGGNGKVVIDYGPDDLLGLECSGATRSIYALPSLLAILQGARQSNAVQLQFNTDFPIRVDYDICDGSGHVFSLLAPRIESE